jgi:hypothetical protein
VKFYSQPFGGRIHQFVRNGITASLKNNGYGCGGRLCGKRGDRSDCNYYVHLPANKVGCQFRQSVVSTLRPSVFDRDVSTFNIAGFTQPLPDECDPRRIGIGRGANEQPNYRNLPLLRELQTDKLPQRQQ